MRQILCYCKRCPEQHLPADSMSGSHSGAQVTAAQTAFGEGYPGMLCVPSEWKNRCADGRRREPHDRWGR